MKYIIAVIKPFKLEEIREALGALGIQGIHRDRSEGSWPPARPHGVLPGCGNTRELRSKVKLELAVDEAIADKVIETIQQSGQTGQIGDGKIFVLPLETAVRIRTGESGVAAL